MCYNREVKFSFPNARTFSRFLRTVFVTLAFLCAGGAWAREETLNGTQTDYTAYDSNNLSEAYILNLTGDVTITGNLKIGPNVTINLNGHSLTVTNVSVGSDSNNYSGSLTLVGTGSFNVTGSLSLASSQSNSIILNSSAEVTINELSGSSGPSNPTSTTTFSGDGTGKLTVTTNSLNSYTSISVLDTTGDVQGLTVDGLTVTDFNTYYWSGESEDNPTLWTESSNWKYKCDGVEKYVSVATYDTEHVDHYPGYENGADGTSGDVAVFAASSVTGDVNITNFTVLTSGNTINLNRDSSFSGKVFINSSIPNGEKIIIKGNFNTFNETEVLTLENVAVKSGTFQVGGELQINGNLSLEGGNLLSYANITVSENLSVESGSGIIYRDNLNVLGETTISGTIEPTALYGEINSRGNLVFANKVNNSGTIDVGIATANFNDSVTNNGTISITTGAININGGYSGTGSISISTGSLTFGENTTNEVETLAITGAGSLTFGASSTATVEKLTITGAGSVTNESSNSVTLKTVDCGTNSSDVTFTGDFKSQGSFIPSSGGTYFIDGNVDFSETTDGTMPETATIYFYNTDSSDSATEKTFTTPSGNFSIPTLYFGGYVKFDLKAALTVTDMYRGADDEKYKLDAGMTSTITGGSLEISNKFDISRLNKTDDDSIIGTLVFDTNVNAKKVDVHSGTTLKINEDKTFSVEEYGTNGDATAPPLNLDISGTLSVGTSLNTVVDCDSNVTIGASGTLSLDSSAANVKTLTNSGTITTETGALTAGTLSNSGEISTESGTISAGSITSTGTISLGSGTLEVTGSEESSISEITLGDATTTGGTISNTGSGTLSIGTLTAGDEEKSVKVKSAEISRVAGSIKVEEASFYADSVVISNSNFDSESLSFTYLSSEDMGGSSISFTGRIDIVDGSDGSEGELVLTGSDADTLLKIVSGDTGVIYLPRPQFSGNFLSVSERVTISKSGDSNTNTYTAYNSAPTSSLIKKIYGWIFANEYYWSGEYSTAWNNKSNWLSKGTIKTGYGRNARYTEGFVTATKVPGEDALVFIESTYKKTQNNGTTVTNNVENFPVLSAASTTVMSATIGENAELSFEGHDFSVLQSFSNGGDIYLSGGKFSVSEDYENLESGTIHLFGTETITLPADTTKITENGTWAFFGGGGGTGILRPIENLSFKKVVAEGNGIVKSFAAGEVEIRKNEKFSYSDEITLKIKAESSDSSVEISAPVLISDSATVDFNETAVPLVFKEKITSETDTALSLYNGANGTQKICFENSVSVNLSVKNEDADSVGNFGSVAFDGNFVQSDGYSFTLSGGAVSVSDDFSFSQGKNGTLIIESGTFSVGKNAFAIGNLIVNSGSSFTQAGANAESDVQSVASIKNDGTVIWDSGDDGGFLILGGSISGRKAAETVFNKKNVSVSADAELSGVFYDLAIADGVKVTNGSGITVRNNFTVDGEYKANGAILRFGEITVESGTTFENGTDGKISGNGTGLNLGDVIFAQKDGTKTVNFTNPVTFESLSVAPESTGSLYLGGKLILNADTTFTTPVLVSYFEIPGSSEHGLEIACGSGKSVTFEKTLETDSSSSGSCSLTVTGDTVLCDDVALDGFTAFGGNLTSSPEDADKELTVKASFIRAFGDADSEWKATSGKLILDSDLFVTLEKGRKLTLANGGDSVLLSANLVLLSGIFSAEAPLSVPENLVAFGENYSSDDPCYSGGDTRFSYYGADSFAYEFDFSDAAAEFASGLSLSVGKNLYVNGADISSCTFTIPDNSASNPVYNETDSVSETQWGIPYAVFFNSAISNSRVECENSDGSAFAAASQVAQGCTDAGGNTGFQFAAPQIVTAYSVSDSVICVTFSMDLENSNGEAEENFQKILYNGGTLSFDGNLYLNPDCTEKIASLSDIAAKKEDGTYIPYYLKSSATWNTDASYESAGNDDSTDRSGIHQNAKIDVTVFEGLFSAAEGKTMCRPYDSEKGLWKEENAGEYTETAAYETADRVPPVLIAVFTGQELHDKNTGSEESQKFYDSHNFIELRYSEPVNIGDLPGSEEKSEKTQNIRASATFASESEHGGAISAKDGGLEIAGFVTIAGGSLVSGYNNNGSHTTDSALPHALYRKFSLDASSDEEFQPCRIRISVAGYVDEENPVSYGGSTFKNWLGYIDSAESPSGIVTPVPNQYITDCAENPNALDTDSSPEITVNALADMTSQDSLYGSWDVLPPVFAAYVTSLDGSEETRWTNGDSETRQYEMVGTVDSNTNAFIDKIEFHLFDNAQNYSSSDSFKWLARNGWMDSAGSSVIPGYSAPESAGGSRGFVSDSAKTNGGIRRSSLSGASSAFTYTYSLDSNESEERPFAETEISQNVKSPLFRAENLNETQTSDDGLYIGIQINESDSNLPIRTSFKVFYDEGKSFITDLAGNRLIQKDSGKDRKTLRTIDITPPSFTMTLSPIGENKIYAVFTKPLAYNGEYLHSLPKSELDDALEKIRTNIEFVYSESDNIDTTDSPSGEKEISIIPIREGGATLKTNSDDYTGILFTLNRNLTLDDIEKIWLRINDNVEITGSIFGNVNASSIQDKFGNSIPAHTCHALSDFAVNAVDVLYARTDSGQDDGWDEQGIYGEGLAPASSDYAVHDFSRDGKNYSKLRSDSDIIFQLDLSKADGRDISLLIDKKSAIKSDWKSDKYNLLTGSDWRIWIDAQMESLASGKNDNAGISKPLVLEEVDGSESLKNITLKNADFDFTQGNEYQFMFKILDSDGNPILLNHDGDKTTPKIPLYALWMPQDRISAGDFSFLDLWSFSLSGISSQRGGVSVLNNVINAGIGEKTAIQVQMKETGSLNIYVMSLDGNIIRRLSKGTVSKGTHYFYWDGKNNAGKPVARGVYFVRVSGSGIDETRKVMVVK